jgi:uncharacterized protein (DUF1778 family)
MSEAITIEAPEATLREIAEAARAEGLSVAEFMIKAASLRARDLADAQTFFGERAKGADFEAFDRILNREGGEPPRPGDELPEGYKRG